jgi:predicted KAP-like P-loop ATPase
MAVSDDLPIVSPSDDKFGLDAFASTIATSIADMQASSGVVLAVNGKWGSGKSSAINLIKHHLAGLVDRGYIAIVTFNPWWFAGADALTLLFLQELNRAIGPSLPTRVRRSLSRLGRGISAAGALAGALANLKLPGLGSVISGATDWVGRASREERTVDEEHRQVAEALAKQPKRFLVVIDDIDRLNPDDALTIFRLVKSVGRLPNVIYLLAFDRQVAERIVSEHFPSEGPSYLEKIIQGAFEIPPPGPDILREQAITGAAEILGNPPEAAVVRFLNIFQDVVVPTIRTPRDVVRLKSQLATTWPAVARNVDRADFLAITAIQLAEPKIYEAIREHPGDLCGTPSHRGQRDPNIAERYDALLCLANRTERERDRLRVALRRLFPRLDSVWSNVSHSSTDQWRRDRLLASRDHFPSYFAFSVSEATLPADQVQTLIDKADDPVFVQEAFRQALTRRRRTGSTLAALLLEELRVYAADVDVTKVGSLVSTLFELADELDVASDELHGFRIGDNPLRLNWLLDSLVHERFQQPERERIYEVAMGTASLGWSCRFAERCVGYFKPREDGHDLGEAIVSEPVADAFRIAAIKKLQLAAKDGSLALRTDLSGLMFAWQRLNNDVSEVRAWTNQALESDAFVLALTKAVPSDAWTQGIGLDEMGDRVARRIARVDLAPFESILDVPRFRERVAQIIQNHSTNDEDRSQLESFLRLSQGNHFRHD